MNIPSPVEREARNRLSLIWIVPILAILVGVGLAIQTLSARGPEITLQFSRAEGLEANKTRIKFKDVEIGTVKAIALSEDQKSVRVLVQMDKQADDLLVEDTQFWVVRPRIAAGGVSGLATLLSGVYIALDPGKSTKSSDEFIGLETPPQITSDTPGRQFLLKTADLGSLDVGVPIYYRRIPVGRVASYEMQKDGKGVDVRVFVDAPYDTFVTNDSRFWHASGVDVSLGAEGVKIDMQSLVSLTMGGIAFATPELEADADAEAMTPAAADSGFFLHPTRAAAMHITDRVVQKYVLTFNESVRGLVVGAAVDYRGLQVGEVSKIDIKFNREVPEFLMLVEINLYPERLLKRTRDFAAGEASGPRMRKIIDRMVQRGFRAQLRTGNVVSGQRYVALDFFPKTTAATVNWSAPTPEMPTQVGTLDSLQDQLLVIVESLRSAVANVDQMVTRLDKEFVPELTETLREARKTLSNADRTLATDSPLQLELRDTLREVGRAAASVRNLTDMLERQPESLLKGKQGDEK